MKESTVLESGDKVLLRTAALAAWTMILIIPIQILIYFLQPPPTELNAWFTLFQRSWLIGLLDLDMLYYLNNILVLLIYLALFRLLLRVAPALAQMGLLLGIVGVAAYFSSSIAFEMMKLSHLWFHATADQRPLLEAAGQGLLLRYTGSAFDVYYLLNGLALILFAIGLYRTRVLGRAVAGMGLTSAVLMVVPSTAGDVGLVMSLLSLVPWLGFLLLLAPKLWKRAKEGENAKR